MRRNLFVLALLVLGLLFLVGQSWAACPQDPNDNGICDTLYVEVWPGDEFVEGSFPHQARFPIRATSDIPDASIDSVAAFVIPLCFTFTNPSANVIIDPSKNKCGAEDLVRIFHPTPFNLNNSIFRDLPSMEDPQELNWMMDLSDAMAGLEWDTRILNLANGNNFWMSLVASGGQDQAFKGGSRVLLATIEFTIEDTTTICIDSCYWPPTGQLIFSRSGAVTYIPRHFLPVCQQLGWGCMYPPDFLDGVNDQAPTESGWYETDQFIIDDHHCEIVAVSADFSGDGVTNVYANVYGSLPSYHVTGYVEYYVADTCAPGGTVVLTAEDTEGLQSHSSFRIDIRNDPPGLTLPDSWRALAGYTMIIEVKGVDPDGDIMGDIELQGFWYEPDSLQAPINPPAYDPGNPGYLSWALTEADTGVWIYVFSLSDSCGAQGLDTLAIEVGLPFCGDCTGDGEINVGDAVCLINYLYRQGTPPEPLCQGDATGDGSINVGDVVLMVNYLFKSLSSPCFDCCDE